MLASRMSGALAKRFSRNASRGLDRAAVHPGQQPEREHVLRARGVLAGEAELLDRLDGHPGQVDHAERVVGQRAVLERVVGVPRLGQVAAGEVVAVHDQRGARAHVGQVGLERGRVHRHQHVGGVTGGQDVVVGEVHLERGDARQGALGCADLGREVGQRHQVVAEGSRLLGEPVTRELHPVAGVTREPDDHPIELLDLLGHRDASFSPRRRLGPVTAHIPMVRTDCTPKTRTGSTPAPRRDRCAVETEPDTRSHDSPPRLSRHNISASRRRRAPGALTSRQVRRLTVSKDGQINNS